MASFARAGSSLGRRLEPARSAGSVAAEAALATGGAEEASAAFGKPEAAAERDVGSEAGAERILGSDASAPLAVLLRGPRSGKKQSSRVHKNKLIIIKEPEPTRERCRARTLSF